MINFIFRDVGNGSPLSRPHKSSALGAGIVSGVGSGGIMGTGSGGGYSGTMDYGSMSSVSNVNWGGGGSLGIS